MEFSQYQEFNKQILIEEYKQTINYYNNLLKNPMYTRQLFYEYYDDRECVIIKLNELLGNYMDIE